MSLEHEVEIRTELSESWSCYSDEDFCKWLERFKAGEDLGDVSPVPYLHYHHRMVGDQIITDDVTVEWRPR
jgi:hypothetical protein